MSDEQLLRDWTNKVIRTGRDASFSVDKQYVDATTFGMTSRTYLVGLTKHAVYLEAPTGGTVYLTKPDDMEVWLWLLALDFLL